jgi:transposase
VALLRRHSCADYPGQRVVDVNRADPLSPTMVEAFADYAQARGLFIDAARVQSPKDKGRVEYQVPYVRESWFAGEQFDDLDAARASARAWCRDIAGTRIHGTTRAVPRDVFESEEAGLLRPAPADTYGPPINKGIDYFD